MENRARMEDLLSVDSSYAASQIASFPLASNLVMLIQFSKTANPICQLKWQVKSVLEPSGSSGRRLSPGP